MCGDWGRRPRTDPPATTPALSTTVTETLYRLRCTGIETRQLDDGELHGHRHSFFRPEAPALRRGPMAELTPKQAPQDRVDETGKDAWFISPLCFFRF